MPENEQPRSPDNIVYIGKKPTMNYVLAVVTQMNGGVSDVFIKARGNSISKAVDVADIVRKRFIVDVKDPSSEMITIGSEELANEDGTKSKVSFIQILASTGRGRGNEISQDSTIYIGKKPTMNYVLAVVTQINSGLQNVVIKARGNSISKAVDVVEIARHRFIPDMKDPSSNGIAIKSEEVANEDGTKSKISSIQINIKK
ncbi:MAG TPA: DNA-binding protein Alba [Candidatus Acidoferrum sp.]|nr:DNA-binding protein Alba [Candidatus Acidoferrum sp.]